MKELIKRIRKSRGETQAAFARSIGTSRAAVGQLEQGAQMPSRDTIGALLRVAQPAEQAKILEAMGIDDVMQFAVDILASAGVEVVFLHLRGEAPGNVFALSANNSQ